MPSDPFLPSEPTPTPLPPTGGPGSPLATDSTLATSTGLPPNVAAGCSVVLTWITGLIFLALEKRNSFVRFWAMQAVFFGIAATIVGIVMFVIGMVLVHIPLIGSLWVLVSILIRLGFLAVWVFMLYKAFTGKTWEIPVLGKMARDQVSKTPLV